MSERIELDDGLDVASLVAAWPVHAPPRDFSERVMAACERADAEPARKRRLGRPLLVVAALVAVAASLVIFTRATPTLRSSAAWSQSDLDLGAPRD